MFEEGDRMRADGKGPVYDFSLGNPDIDPPADFLKRLKELVNSPLPGMHKYMANVGFDSTRAAVAAYVQSEFGIESTEKLITMTVGAGGGLNVALKAILDPGDEVLVLTPFFVEYGFYIDNHGGVMVKVPTKPGFDIDVDAVASAITPRTKAMLINSPNNPTGVVYSSDSLKMLASVLRERGKQHGSTIYLISDEPYRKIVFDMARCPSVLVAYENSIMVTSHSKDLAVPGERIGWIVIHPGAADSEKLAGAMAFANRTLGFVNAPALMQRVIEKCLDSSIDLDWYRRKRDLLYTELIKYGYEVTKPHGAFYMFPKAPGGDDIAFCRALAKRRVLVVPGTGFGTPGYFRIAYCFHDAIIEGALPAFEAARREFK
jgi:aspartate aminotransferase